MFFRRAQAFMHGEDSWAKALLYAAGTAAVFALSVSRSFSALHPHQGSISDMPLKPPRLHHPNSGVFASRDYASVRRGYQVYREVCASCHALSKLNFRDLVGVTHTEAQTRALAAATEVRSAAGPRAAKLDDAFPAPFASKEEAKAANDGLYPPDLSAIVSQNFYRRDYVFALLTGYAPPPPGVAPIPGKAWNKYFQGHWIGMAPPLAMHGLVDYEDGTEATREQMAWDVMSFLSWADYPTDERAKRRFPMVALYMSVFVLSMGYMTRGAKMASKAELWSWRAPMPRR